MTLTGEQQRILAHRSGALRIAAGAGTGKTDILRRHIVQTIEGGARPGEILCLTFTVEATNEMRRRVVSALGGRAGIDPDELTVQTYHAFAAAIVRQNALVAGLDGDPALLDRARAWQLVLAALDRVEFDGLEIGWLPTFIGRLLTLVEELERHLVSSEQVADWCRARGDDVALRRLESLRAIDAYGALKRERNAIDYGDQIALAVRVLRDAPAVLERLRARYRYVYLDEYQDTDVAQRELVKLVGTGAALVCAVGDVSQGIFGWRGATIHNMSAFPDDLPGAATQTLSVNRRSAKPVLDLANALIAPWEPPDERAPLVPAPDAPEGAVDAFVAGHQLDEADEIGERIAAAGEPWSQYAVLTRTRAMFDPIYRALVARGVPVEVDTLGGFWTRPEILDVLSWLRILDDPGDNLALARLLLGPAYGLSRRDLFFLADWASKGNRPLRYESHELLRFSLADALVENERIESLSDEARTRIERLRATWRELAAIATRVSLADLVGEIGRVSGLDFELAASPNPESDLARRHLAKLRDLAQGYQPVAGSLDLAGFVDYLDSIDEAEQDEDELRAADPNAVRLLTLHRAKGLEWDVVFLPGLVKGQMPHPGKGQNNPEQCWFRLPFELRGDREFLPEQPTTQAQLDQLRDEEERRLMYVGVTRARRRVVLSRAWFYRDNIGAKQPSIFWDEALETGIPPRAWLDCPEVNPYPLGVEGPVEPERRFEPPPPDPVEIAQREGEVERLRGVEAARPRAARWQLPSTISVTALLTFLRDEDEFYWRYVRRVPAPPSPAAKLGIELHRRIEAWARGGGAGLAPLPDEGEEAYDLDPSERRGDGSGVSAEQMWANFQASRFARRKPLMTEQPFTLYLGEGLSVTGRIDAIFEADDGTWEVVDYKTGVSEPDPLQLGIYSEAVTQIWGKQPRCYWILLRSGEGRVATARPEPVAELGEAASRLRKIVQAPK